MLSFHPFTKQVDNENNKQRTKRFTNSNVVGATNKKKW